MSVAKTVTRTVYGTTYHCSVVFAQYQQGQTCIRLVSEQSGEPISTATVCVPEVEVPEGHVLIKNWSENEGILRELVEAGIIGWPVGAVDLGHCTALLCPLLVMPG